MKYGLSKKTCSAGMPGDFYSFFVVHNLKATWNPDQWDFISSSILTNFKSKAKHHTQVTPFLILATVNGWIYFDLL